MQFPIDLHIGSVIIPSHFIFNFLAIGLAFAYYRKMKSKTDETPTHVRRMILLWGFIGALFGARLLDMAYVARTSIFDSIGIFAYFMLGGKTIVGALAGGIAGVEITKWAYGIKKSVGDAFTFPLIYGIIIGRVGCFLTGVADDTTGIPSSLPWAFDQGDGIPRHPTAIYEIIFLGALWILLAYMQKKKRFQNGVVFRIFIVAYFAFRFAVDFLKPGPVLLYNMTAIQLLCLAGIVCYSIDIARKQFSYGRNSTQSN